jgi:hypothetical protein
VSNSLILQVNDELLDYAALLLLRKVIRALQVVGGEHAEWVELWLLISWSFDNQCIFIKLVGIAKMKNE